MMSQKKKCWKEKNMIKRNDSDKNMTNRETNRQLTFLV